MRNFIPLKRQISRQADFFLPIDRLINKRYIFALHRVLPKRTVETNYYQSCMFITPETLEGLIKWSFRLGDIVGIDELLDFDTNNSRPLFAFTFDDGWRDNYDYAFPVLKKYNINATIFLVTDAINTCKMLWPEDFLAKADLAFRLGKGEIIRQAIYDEVGGRGDIYRMMELYLEELKEKTFHERELKLQKFFSQIDSYRESFNFSSMLTWNQIREMSRAGISFGSHTHTHLIMQYSDGETIYQELKISKEIIEKEIGREVKLFSYPNARYRLEDEKIVASFYEKAFRIHNLPVHKNVSRFFIPRFIINEPVCNALSYLKFRLLGVPHY